MGNIVIYKWLPFTWPVVLALAVVGADALPQLLPPPPPPKSWNVTFSSTASTASTTSSVDKVNVDTSIVTVAKTVWLAPTTAASSLDLTTATVVKTVIVTPAVTDSTSANATAAGTSILSTTTRAGGLVICVAGLCKPYAEWEELLDTATTPTPSTTPEPEAVSVCSHDVCEPYTEVKSALSTTTAATPSTSAGFESFVVCISEACKPYSELQSALSTAATATPSATGGTGPVVCIGDVCKQYSEWTSALGTTAAPTTQLSRRDGGPIVCIHDVCKPYHMWTDLGTPFVTKHANSTDSRSTTVVTDPLSYGLGPRSANLTDTSPTAVVTDPLSYGLGPRSADVSSHSLFEGVTAPLSLATPTHAHHNHSSTPSRVATITATATEDFWTFTYYTDPPPTRTSTRHTYSWSHREGFPWGWTSWPIAETTTIYPAETYHPTVLVTALPTREARAEEEDCLPGEVCIPCLPGHICRHGPIHMSHHARVTATSLRLLFNATMAESPTSSMSTLERRGEELISPSTLEAHGGLTFTFTEKVPQHTQDLEARDKNRLCDLRDARCQMMMDMMDYKAGKISTLTWLYGPLPTANPSLWSSLPTTVPEETMTLGPLPWGNIRIHPPLHPVFKPHEEPITTSTEPSPNQLPIVEAREGPTPMLTALFPAHTPHPPELEGREGLTPTLTELFSPHSSGVEARNQPTSTSVIWKGPNGQFSPGTMCGVTFIIQLNFVECVDLWKEEVGLYEWMKQHPKFKGFVTNVLTTSSIQPSPGPWSLLTPPKLKRTFAAPELEDVCADSTDPRCCIYPGPVCRHGPPTAPDSSPPRSGPILSEEEAQQAIMLARGARSALVAPRENAACFPHGNQTWCAIARGRPRSGWNDTATGTLDAHAEKVPLVVHADDFVCPTANSTSCLLFPRPELLLQLQHDAAPLTARDVAAPLIFRKENVVCDFDTPHHVLWKHCIIFPEAQRNASELGYLQPHEVTTPIAIRAEQHKDIICFWMQAVWCGFFPAAPGGDGTSIPASLATRLNRTTAVMAEPTAVAAALSAIDSDIMAHATAASTVVAESDKTARATAVSTVAVDSEIAAKMAAAVAARGLQSREGVTPIAIRTEQHKDLICFWTKQPWCIFFPLPGDDGDGPGSASLLNGTTAVMAEPTAVAAASSAIDSDIAAHATASSSTVDSHVTRTVAAAVAARGLQSREVAMPVAVRIEQHDDLMCFFTHDSWCLMMPLAGNDGDGPVPTSLLNGTTVIMAESTAVAAASSAVDSDIAAMVTTAPVVQPRCLWGVCQGPKTWTWFNGPIPGFWTHPHAPYIITRPTLHDFSQSGLFWSELPITHHHSTTTRSSSSSHKHAPRADPGPEPSPACAAGSCADAPAALTTAAVASEPSGLPPPPNAPSSSLVAPTPAATPAEPQRRGEQAASRTTLVPSTPSARSISSKPTYLPLTSDHGPMLAVPTNLPMSAWIETPWFHGVVADYQEYLNNWYLVQHIPATTTWREIFDPIPPTKQPWPMSAPADSQITMDTFRGSLAQWYERVVIYTTLQSWWPEWWVTQVRAYETASFGLYEGPLIETVPAPASSQTTASSASQNITSLSSSSSSSSLSPSNAFGDVPQMTIKFPPFNTTTSSSAASPVTSLDKIVEVPPLTFTGTQWKTFALSEPGPLSSSSSASSSDAFASASHVEINVPRPTTLRTAVRG